MRSHPSMMGLIGAMALASAGLAVEPGQAKSSPTPRPRPTALDEARIAAAEQKRARKAAVARERSDTGRRDRSDEQVPGNTPDQDQRP